MRKDNRRITLLSDGNIRFGNKIYDFETVFNLYSDGAGEDAVKIKAGGGRFKTTVDT